MNYKKLNNIIGWTIFLVALYTYTATMESTVSLWDCGEYIATSYKLEVGHPPGAPLFNMLGRMFSAFVPTHDVAWSINFMSALVSALTILFLFWSITHLAKKMALSSGGTLEGGSIIAILGSGAIGALAYTFSDSFWFSAVEGEVYAMSSFFTAAVVWATFRWEEVADEPGADRWLILIFFLVGLSIGVHLLNLLAIPAIAYVYYFRKYKTTTTKGVIYTGIIGMGVLTFVQSILIPGIVSFPALMERAFKNGMGFPFNVGLMVFFVILIALVVAGLYWTKKRGSALFNTCINAFIVLCIGYSCFFMTIIRSSANTPIDENNPENPISFLSYANREQYGSWPVLYGPYWNSAVDVQNEDGYTVDGSPQYMRGFSVKRGEDFVQGFRTEKEAKDYVAAKKLTGVEIIEEYFISDDRKGIEYKYLSEHMTLFPRMFSRDPRHIDGYTRFSGYDPNNGGESFTDPITGKTEVLPTFGNNLQYFFNYQIGWMYWRYFLWNFAGRQNDEQGMGPGPLEGNWLTGINMIDKEHIGDQSKLPGSMTRNRAHNKFFMLPLILGIIGFFFQFFYSRKDWFIVTLLFIFTGFMIIIYLNPKPYDPRERDYAYAASFYAFAFWIGLGIWALYDAAKRIQIKNLATAGGVALGFGVLLLGVESASGTGHTFSYSVIYISLVSFALLGIMTQLGKAKMSTSTIGIIACLLGAPVPLIMAGQGWDDHDRSNRTTALDFASNFLETCDKNAIIFTHGDNDTFPLWYAQEVEGIRTDVRIVNLSLLGTDWYIDQMLRKAYDSDPVPFSAPEYMYRQGGLLDYVSLDATQNKEGVFLDLEQAMGYVMNDDNAKSGQGGRRFMSIPSRTFSMKVDKATVEKYMVVDKEDLKRVLPEIQFTIPKSSLYKNDVMILDLIANNKWKRPVYFAGGADSKTYLGLQDYFSSEGLAYKFIPIKTPGTNPNAFGKVNIDKMYHNIMKVYKWGNMQTKGVNVDYYVRRTMTNNYRLMFYTLAQELANEGRQAEAKESNSLVNIKMIEDTLAKGYGNKTMLSEQLSRFKSVAKTEGAKKTKYFSMCDSVITKCFFVMPEFNVPYDRIVPSFVPILYQIGKKDKAREIIDIMVKQEYANFEFYCSLEPRFSTGVLESAQVSFRIIGMLEQISRENKDVEKADSIRSKEEMIAGKLTAWVTKCLADNQEYAASFAEYFPQLFQQQQPQAPRVPQ
jgi:hypothetical protein